MQLIEPVAWSADGAGVRILDQRQLPARETYWDLRSIDEVCDAIRSLAVRGAPAIGIAGAMGLTLALDGGEPDREHAQSRIAAAADRVRATRPTAVNLGWAVDRMLSVAMSGRELVSLRDELRREATRILAEDRDMCRRIGEHGAALIPDGARVLTHCNAGALATGGLGTALAAIYVAVEQGKRVEVFVDETRPLLQGSRLTAWELTRAGIPVSVLVDSAAATLMRSARIDLCIVGADRIATNGDVANKIGTYGVAIAARHHRIPFYVAAPASTFDPSTASGDDIVIEQRSPDEVRCGFGVPTAPADVDVFNPAFDVTPASLITAIVSDRAVHRPPFDFSHTR
ncbi:MAG TPA: S-methyl-5-thioribose-1-phosphate isomerase [Gemmatimonadaceae bacterium]